MSQQVKDILEANTYMVLSTVGTDSQPWGTPVHFAFDDQAVYWISSDATQHSQNIAANKKLFITIFNSQQEGGKDRAALYIATAGVSLEAGEADTVHDTVFVKRFPGSKGVGEGAHLFRAPIGVLNQEKSKAGMLYYHSAEQPA